MTFKIYTLGCKVNSYESDVMSDLLVNNNFTKVNIKEEADIIIINTCTVTNTADNKSMKRIREAYREPHKIIVVCGCMTQGAKEDIKEADIVIGNIGKNNIVNYINNYIEDNKEIFEIKDIMHTEFEDMVLNNTNKTRAFVKIQDGCNNFCSYCIIPYTRGNVKSKNFNTVIEEVTTLVNNNHKEVVLSGIHTGHYGSDIGTTLSNLLLELVKIKGLERIRISSIEITELDNEFLEVLKNNKILVDHMHIPLQSGSNEILKLMNRKYDKEYFINKVEQIRNIRPNISISTDLIVGFPNETDELFEETIDTIKKIRFSKIHVFPYSRRKGTPADLMDNQVDQVIKKQRVKKIMELSRELEKEYMNKFIGQKLEVIKEVEKDEYIIGHTSNFLLVKFKSNEIKDKYVVELDKVDYPYVIGKTKC